MSLMPPAVIAFPTPALECGSPEGARSPLRRLVLHVDLRTVSLPVAMLPLRFGWEAWRDDRAAAHAAVLYEGFREGIDATYMPALSTLEGCDDLITATSHHQDFVPEATWMAVQYGLDGTSHPVSSIQVIGSPLRAARIQNLAVLPDVRGRGIARATLMRCLRSCRSLGYDLVELEVTELNAPAVELYRSAGFVLRRSYLHEAGR
jgi:ribosomal protein S18 acetylase RimI-like enzyme